MPDLAPRLVLITGGCSTIGEALVRAFGDAGLRVFFSYFSSEASARRLARALNAEAIPLDFAGTWEPPHLPVDILINNAGVNLSGHSLDETTEDELRTSFAINFLAPFRLAKAYVPRMRAQRFGRIININSLWGLQSPAQRLSYSASKFSLRALTENLAIELARDGVTANDICPGPVDSRMLRAMGTEAVGEGRFADLRDYLSSVSRDVPIQRLITPADVARTAVFLASDDAGALTGLALRVDGGLGGT